MKKFLPFILLILAFFKLNASMAQTLLWSRFDSSDVVYYKSNLKKLFPDKVIDYDK